MKRLVHIAICVCSIVSAAAAQQPEVLDIGPRDIPAPPAGWFSPYGAYRLVTGERAPAVAFEVAAARLENRPAWDAFEPAAERPPRHPAEKYLEGMTIVLDPGHGGDAILTNYKRGPTGVREAEANLRVALLLADLLRQAGVTVHLTRDRDNGLSLADRAELANELNADFLISLHHNAAEAERVNYTSVWLHNDYADNGPALDLARYVSLGIARHLRTDAAYTSPLMSDRQIYESGFGVLRHARVPALLVESSFHTNLAEEQRLNSADHNLREAYGIYEGLCEYALGGTPTQAVTVEGDMLNIELKSGLPRWWGDDRRGPVADSIVLIADGERVSDFAYDPTTRRLTTSLSGVTDSIALRFTNVNGHQNWPQRYKVDLGNAGKLLRPLPPERVEQEPATRPSDAPPWAALPENGGPYVLLDGGDAAAQAFINSLDLPEGSALTIARIDPATGDLYALRHESQTRRGLQSTGDDGFPLGSLRRLPIALAVVAEAERVDARVDFEAWKLRIDGRTTGLVDEVHAALAEDDHMSTHRLLDLADIMTVHELVQQTGVEKLIVRNARPLAPAMWVAAGQQGIQSFQGDRSLLPLNADTRHPESNGGRADWASTDDLIRLMAAVVMGESRSQPGHDVIASAMREAEGPVSAAVADLDDLDVLELAGAETSVAYVYDAQLDRHYLIAGHADATQLSAAVKAWFAALRAGRTRF